MFKSIIKHAWQRIYRIYSVQQHVTIGKNFHIGLFSRVDAPRHLTIGDNVYIGKFSSIECDGSIGDHVMIANNVGLIGRYDHDFRCVGKPIRLAPWIGDRDYSGMGTDLELVIEDDVWIGFAAVVVGGIRIGRGAIIGAGTVVTHDVAPYAIVVGNPMRRIGWRFGAEEIREHERLISML
jgi:acetyltransferase-like isoleucine patch superfamily enzyme